MTDGTVRCWGGNGFGELGDGTLTDRSEPLPVAGLVGVTQISVGGSYPCARRSGASVWCWGGQGQGRLGDGVTAIGGARPTPAEVLW